MRARRAQEAYEREWRRKEKEAAERHAASERQLREERLKQQLDREHSIAVEALKMRREFHEMVNRAKKSDEKLKEVEVEKHVKNRMYAQEIKQQIVEKEQVKKKEREETFMEGIRRLKEEQEKLKKLEAIKERKLNELRALGVPEKYCGEIKRKTKESMKPKISNQPQVIPDMKREAAKGKAA